MNLELSLAGGLLEAAEAASPVDAVAAVTRELGLSLGATEVSFLIADISGRALVRLTHVPLGHPGANGRGEPAGNGERRDSEDYATVVPLDGGPAEQTVRTQTVQVAPPGDATGGWGVTVTGGGMVVTAPDHLARGVA